MGFSFGSYLLFDDVLIPYFGGKRGYLILDCFWAHQNVSVVEHLEAAGISIIEVPAGQTGDLQPLDVGVFGAVKAKIRQSWADSHAEHETTWGWNEALRSFRESLGTLSSSSIRSAFEKAIGFYEEAPAPSRLERRRNQRTQESHLVSVPFTLRLA